MKTIEALEAENVKLQADVVRLDGLLKKQTEMINQLKVILGGQPVTGGQLVERAQEVMRGKVAPPDPNP